MIVIKRLFLLLFGFQLAACASIQTPVSEVTDTFLPPTQTSVPTAVPSATITYSPEPSSTFTAIPSPTPLPTPTGTPTPIPKGFGVVPDVVGMHYLDARKTLMGAGFTFLYSDVYSQDHPFGTIMEQYPGAGSVEQIGKMIFLYRAFQAPGMWVGEKCMPLKIATRQGKLLFAVYLEEEARYEIRTDFSHGQTSIFDYRMSLLDSFDNQVSDLLFFEPEWTAWYVISLGPYEISQGELDKHPGGVPAGCLWVVLIEE